MSNQPVTEDRMRKLIEEERGGKLIRFYREHRRGPRRNHNVPLVDYECGDGHNNNSILVSSLLDGSKCKECFRLSKICHDPCFRCGGDRKFKNGGSRINGKRYCRICSSYVDLRKKFSGAKRFAKSKGKIWSSEPLKDRPDYVPFPYEEWLKVVARPCYACDKTSDQETGSWCDRINSKDLEYSFHKVLPCCGDCNSMRMDDVFTLREIKAIRLIRRYLGSVDTAIEHLYRLAPHLFKDKLVVLNPEKLLPEGEAVNQV